MSTRDNILPPISTTEAAHQRNISLASKVIAEYLDASFATDETRYRAEFALDVLKFERGKSHPIESLG